MMGAVVTSVFANDPVERENVMGIQSTRSQAVFVGNTDIVPRQRRKGRMCGPRGLWMFSANCFCVLSDLEAPAVKNEDVT